MRSLPSALTTAQQQASGEPHVDVTVENSIAGIRRLDFAILDQTANTIARHDVCAAGDGSVTRVRNSGSGSIYAQRATTPASPAEYAGTWISLASGQGTLIACAARATRVCVVYVNAAGTGLKMRESTNYGSTFAAEVAVATLSSTPSDLAVAYKNDSGDMLIAWTRGAQAGIDERTGGTFGGIVENAIGAATLTGIALAHGADWDMILTGTEVTTSAATVWSYIYGDGGDVANGSFGTLRVQHQAEADAVISYTAPSLIYADTYRYTFLETQTFAGGNVRVYRSWLHPGLTFASGAFTHRSGLPVNYSGTEGLACAVDTAAWRYYETAPNYVQYADGALSRVTLTADVTGIDIHEEPARTRGYIDLDNSSGLYAANVLPAGFAAGNLVVVKWGYHTASGLLTSAMPDLWCTGLEWRRERQRSYLRLWVDGGWELLARARERGQVVNTGNTYQTIIARATARAGLQFTSSAPSTRSTAVTPLFVIAADTPARTTLDRALAFLADRIRMKASAALEMTEPLASASSSYTYGAAHPLRAVRYHLEPPEISEQLTIGAAAWGEAIDYPNAGLGLGTRGQQRDINSASGTTAANTAIAHLRQRALEARAGELIVPPNCGQEMLDMVDFTDLYMDAAAIKRRVEGIRWRYDRHAGLYEQTLTLGAA